MTVFGIFKSFGNPKQRWRLISLVISIPFSFIAYFSIYSLLYPNGKNFFEFFGSDAINIYSGEKKGVYDKIGRSMVNTAEGLTLKNNNSRGSLDNIRKVKKDPNGIGLAQEEYVDTQNDESIVVVAPLYMEKLHILFRSTSREEDNKDRLKILTLDSYTDTKTLGFFQNKKIGTGPVGSGTREIASFLFKAINEQFVSHFDSLPGYELITVDGVQDGLERLSCESCDNSLDVYLFVSGAPLCSVQQLLKEHDGAIGMMSLTPSLVLDIVNATGIDYHTADFGRMYTEERRIGTLGTEALLIANPSIKTSDINDILTTLSSEGFRNVFRHLLNENESLECDVDEFLLGEEMINRNKQSWLISGFEFFSGLGFFLLTFITTWVGLVSSIIWLISVLKQQFYFRRVYLITSEVFSMRIKIEETSTNRLRYEEQDGSVVNLNYKKYLKESIQMLESIDYYVKPKMEDDDKKTVNVVVWAISELFILSNKLHLDYRTGGITDQHYGFITNFIHKARTSLRKLLNQELTRALDKGKGLPMYTIGDYFHKGFITQEDYKYLRSRSEEPSED